MALKGGTGIRKVYIEQYRFSDDLDFTLIEKYELDNLDLYLRESGLGISMMCIIFYPGWIGPLLETCFMKNVDLQISNLLYQP